MTRIELSPAVSDGKKKNAEQVLIDVPRNFSRRFLRKEKNAEQVLLTCIEISPADFLRKEKTKPRSYRTYSQRFRKEKRRFGNYHEVLHYFLLFVVKNKKILLFFFETPKNSFYNSTNKEHPFH